MVCLSNLIITTAVDKNRSAVQSSTAEEKKERLDIYTYVRSCRDNVTVMRLSENDKQRRRLCGGLEFRYQLHRDVVWVKEAHSHHHGGKDHKADVGAGCVRGVRNPSISYPRSKTVGADTELVPYSTFINALQSSPVFWEGVALDFVAWLYVFVQLREQQRG